MRFLLSFRSLLFVWYLTLLLTIGYLHAVRAAGNHGVRKPVASVHRGGRRTGAGRQKSGRAISARRWECDPQAIPPKGTYCRLYHVKATAYMPRRAEGGRYTFTQRDGRAAHGIAVDPRMIPLGTQLWVPGYGKAIADDVGSAIQGHHIDVRVQERNQESAWGARHLCVYVLHDPS